MMTLGYSSTLFYALSLDNLIKALSAGYAVKLPQYMVTVQSVHMWTVH
jgi:hypothetical protein